MLQLLRMLLLVIVAGILVDAVIRIGTGTTGTLEKSAVAAIGCLWILACRRELRGLRLGAPGRRTH